MNDTRDLTKEHAVRNYGPIHQHTNRHLNNEISHHIEQDTEVISDTKYVQQNGGINNRRETIISRRQVQHGIISRRQNVDRINYDNSVLSTTNSTCLISHGLLSNDNAPCPNFNGSNMSLDSKMSNMRCAHQNLRVSQHLSKHRRSLKRPEYIPLDNRLVVTQSVWFLKEISRDTAVRYLQHHRQGVCIFYKSLLWI